MKRNKFKRALHHLNKKHVVESAPTNSTLGVFSVTPSGVGPVGWTDRTFTTDISGNPLPKDEVADFTVGESPADSTEAKDTTGLFEADGVTVKTLTPPGDNSYILGPFSSMWYAWGNFTTLGYIEEGTRKMRNLGTITGKLSDWDGSSINSYGQLTLEQALWFRDVKKFGDIDNDPANHNYRAFYPGPPSNTPDAFGRYLCVIAASREAGGTETRPGAPDNPTQPGEMSADDNFSSILNKIGRGAQRAGSMFKGAMDSVVNFYSGVTGSRLGQYAAMIAAKSTVGAMDNIIYGRSGHLIKGLSKGRQFKSSFTGAGPSSGIAGKIFRGKKLVDWGDSIINGSVNMISRAVGGKGGFAPNILRNMVGKNYAGQWFTDPTRVNVATGYAGKGGTISMVPRTGGKFGWKNWLGSNTSRSLGFPGLGGMQPETFQRTEDILSVMEGGAKSMKGFGKNALRIGGARVNLDLDNPKTQRLLQKYATKVATNSKTLKTIARGIPVLGAGISAADAAYRFSQGDWKGGVLSIASMVPGPVGWFALGSQVAVDTGALEKAIEFGYNRQTGFNPDTGMFEPRTNQDWDARRAARGGGDRNQYGQNIKVDSGAPAKPSGNAETAKIDLEIAKIETKMSGNVSQYEKNRLKQQLSRAKQRLSKAQSNLDSNHEKHVQDWDARRSARGSSYKPPSTNVGELPGNTAPGADVPAVNTSREVDGRVEYNRGLKTDPDGREYYEILTYPKGGSLYSGGAYTFKSYLDDKTTEKDSDDPGMPSNPDFRGPGNNKNFKPEPKPPEKDYERNRRRNRPKYQFNDYMLDGDFLVEEKQEQYTSANMDELKDEMRKAGIPIDDPEEMADQFGLASLAAGMNPEIVEIIQLAIVGAELTPKQEKDISQSMMEFSGVMYANEKAEQISGKNTNELADKDSDSTQDAVNEVRILSESRKRHVIREIKKPITLPETKKKFKVKPKVLGHPSNKTLSDQMKDTTPNVAFKKEIPVWSMDQKIRNARSSQEKKNEVLEYLGSSGDHWEYMTKTIKEHNKKIINLNYGGKKKKVTRKEQVDKDILVFMEDDLGNKSSVLQSKINEMQAEAGDKEMFAKYYEMHPQKKSLFKEVVKRGVFDYPKKPSKKGYPDKEPAKLDPNTGMHPEYGKKYKHDKLDPHSAESMPMQGDPEIDANISKNVDPEKKKRKSKILSQPNG